MKSTIGLMLLIAAVARCQASVDDELKGVQPPKRLPTARLDYGRQTGGTFYYGLDKPLTWNAAERYCQQFGQDLVKIDNLRTFIDLQGELHYHGMFDKSLWSSGNSLESSGVWKWGMGTDRHLNKYVYSNWAPNQPTSDASKRCLSLQAATLEWMPSDCNNDLHYPVCENKYTC